MFCSSPAEQRGFQLRRNRKRKRKRAKNDKEEEEKKGEKDVGRKRCE